MPIKKTSLKKNTQASHTHERPRFVYKKRRNWTNYFSHSFVAFISILFVVTVEALFGYPSKWFEMANVNNRDKPLYEEIVIEETCKTDTRPVCGIDGKTYKNRCDLDEAKVTFAYRGECREEQPKNKIDEAPVNTGVVSSEIPPPLVASGALTGALSGTGGPFPYQTYKNTIFDYELSLPKYAYYRGYATKNKKGHTLAIDLKDELTANFDTALVRVAYTKAGDAVPIGSKMTFSLDKGTMTIDYDDPVSDKVKEIIDAITSTAKTIYE